MCSNRFLTFECLNIQLRLQNSFSLPRQVKSKTPRTPRTTSVSCTSSRPPIGTKGRRGRRCTRTLPAPQTPATSAGSSAMSRTRCCSSPSEIMESSDLRQGKEKDLAAASGGLSEVGFFPVCRNPGSFLNLLLGWFCSKTHRLHVL